MTSHWVVVKYLKMLLVRVLLAAWTFFILRLALEGIRFDLSKGWFIALVSIALVSPVIIFRYMQDNKANGGKLWRGTAIEEFAKDADIAKVEPPRCKYCGTTEAPIFVRAHLECPKCHTVTESCCDGGRCG